MLFNSYEFLIFFPIVVFIYFIFPIKYRYLWLLAASYFFYMNWNAKYALLLLFSTLITYLSGLVMNQIRLTEKENKEKLLKLCVCVSFIINLGLLFIFKYANFVLSIFSAIMNLAGRSVNITMLDILLPVGISFYIFQALSYTMDVYRKNVETEKNFFRYALFVSFFPQLVAGPIERSKNLLVQLKIPQKFNFENMRNGLLLMLWGYFMKLVISDRIAVVVDCIYGAPQLYPGVYLIIATLLFGIQLYCDFAGYSTIAMGAAKVMGFQLMDNFNCPYFSRNTVEFWHRWHISLSTWFRDYLYIPLGGNQKGKIRKYLNILIVFFMSGAWHGAAISFITWGVLNGLYQIVGMICKPVRDRINCAFNLNRKFFSHKLFGMITTFLLYDFSLIFFRADSFSIGVDIIKSMLSTCNWEVLTNDALFSLGLDWKDFAVLFLALCILFIADLFKYKGYVIRDFVFKQELWFRWVFYITSVVGILIFGMWGSGYDGGAFIYFQF